LEQAIRDAVPEWSLAKVVTALQAMRGIDLVAAVTVLAEIGDLSRFQNPRELMGYLGLVPSESSTGDTVNRGSITKAGNGRVRRILIESAWSYRYPPRVSREKQMKVAAAPRAVREIAWKAQMREPIAKLPSGNWDSGSSRLAMIARRVFCKPALDHGAVDAMHWQFLDAARLCGVSSVSNWAAHGSRSDDQSQELIAGQRQDAEHQVA
jgi:hypothetical protein